jgi:hypothetical protein
MEQEKWLFGLKESAKEYAVKQFPHSPELDATESTCYKDFMAGALFALKNVEMYNPTKYSDKLKDVLKDLGMGFYNQMGSAWCQKIVDKINRI